jgi:hypothetical protein
MQSQPDSIVYTIHKNRLEAALKRDLLERGMSAEEVATDIWAKAGKTAGRSQATGVTRGGV